MKLTKRLVVLAALAVVTIGGGGFAAYQVLKPVDHHLYAMDPATNQRISDQPLLFLYAVNSQTGEIVTYSPVESDLKAASAAIAQTPTKVDAKSTLTGYAASITAVHIDSRVDRSKETFLPSLTWVDLQGSMQKQFFVDGVDVVYISDQPLKQSNDHLDTVISVPVTRQ